MFDLYVGDNGEFWVFLTLAIVSLVLLGIHHLFKV